MTFQGVSSRICFLAQMTLVLSGTNVKLHVSFEVSTAGEFQVTGWAAVWLLREQNAIASIFLFVALISIIFRNAKCYSLIQL